MSANDHLRPRLKITYRFGHTSLHLRDTASQARQHTLESLELWASHKLLDPIRSAIFQAQVLDGATTISVRVEGHLFEFDLAP